jgi:hypothetical protein
MNGPHFNPGEYHQRPNVVNIRRAQGDVTVLDRNGLADKSDRI